MTKAIINNIPMRWIHESALKRQALIDSKQELIIGVNCYENNTNQNFETLSIDNKQVIEEQIKSLKKLRTSRDQKMSK